MAVKKKASRAGVDPVRHAHIFNPKAFGEKRIDIVGCGAVGSRIAMEVAKLGVRNLHLWDGDTVASQNVANQLFGIRDVGRKKVTALAEHIRFVTNLKPFVHPCSIEGFVGLGKVVFLAVDTMAARKNIFKTCMHLKYTTDLVVEVRMGVEELRVYGFNPRQREEVAAWMRTLVDDAKTVENACQLRTTVGATAGMTASLAVHRFLQWHRKNVDPKGSSDLDAPFEQVMMLRPLHTITNSAVV